MNSQCYPKRQIYFKAPIIIGSIPITGVSATLGPSCNKAWCTSTYPDPTRYTP